MTTLEKIFYKCNEFKIYPCLDESYCYTDTNIKIPKNYIGCIYSITNIDEILESISEEGSSIINYKIKSIKSTEKIINIFSTILIDYGFDPFIDNDVVSIVISYKDIFGNIKEEEYEIDEDDEDIDNDEEDTEDNDEDEDTEVNDEDEDTEVKDEEDDEDEDTEVKDEEDDDEDEEVKDEEDEEDKDEEDTEVEDNGEEDTEVKVEEEKEDTEEEKEDIEHEQETIEDEYTHEKLKKKYRAELVELAQNLGITTWKGKNIQKHLKSDIIDCIINQKK
uniref:Uncharacterized protein n=1 Tax=viral metagenome TaxID=1070528 RepID=A0A6C0E0H3_9ZZZZ